MTILKPSVHQLH